MRKIIVLFLCILVLSNLFISFANANIHNPQAQKPPSAPQNLTVSLLYGKPNLIWSEPMDKGGAYYVRYKIYRSEYTNNYSSGAHTTDWSLTYFYNADAVDCKKYFYTVTAFNDAGESSRSNEVNIIVENNCTKLQPPSAPQNLDVSLLYGKPNLTWTEPSSKGGANFVKYRIYRSETPNYYSSYHTTEWYLSTFYNSDALDCKKYYYTVTAYNDAGESPKSNEDSIFVDNNCSKLQPPSAPQNLEVNLVYGKPNITWKEPSSKGGANFVKYRIYRSEVSSYYSSYHTTELYSTTFYNSDAQDCKKYYYTVTAYNDAGESPKSNEGNIFVANNCKGSVATPSEPRNFRLEEGYANGMRVLYKKFDPPINNGGAEISQYNVYQFKNNQWEYTGYIVPRNINLAHVQNIVDGQYYKFMVKAYNGTYEGAPAFAEHTVGKGSNGGCKDLPGEIKGWGGGFEDATSDGYPGKLWFTFNVDLIPNSCCKIIKYNISYRFNNEGAWIEYVHDVNSTGKEKPELKLLIEPATLIQTKFKAVNCNGEGPLQECNFVSAPLCKPLPNIANEKASYEIILRSDRCSINTTNDSQTVTIKFPEGTFIPDDIKPKMIRINGVPLNSPPMTWQDLNIVSFRPPINLLPWQLYIVTFDIDAGIKNPINAKENNELEITYGGDCKQFSRPFQIISNNKPTPPTIWPDWCHVENNYIKITWYHSDHEKGYQNLYYKIFRTDTGDAADLKFLASTSQLSYDDYQIENCKSYMYVVRAVKENIESGPSNLIVLSFTKGCKKPSPPRNLNVFLKDGKPFLYWTEPEDKAGFSNLKYYLYRIGDTWEDNFVYCDILNQTYWHDTLANDCKKYKYYVEVYGDNKEFSDPSNEVQIYTKGNGCNSLGRIINVLSMCCLSLL